jgi:hypothetical protein
VRSGRVIRELELGDATAAKSEDAFHVSDSAPEKHIAWWRIGPPAKGRGHDEIEVRKTEAEVMV